MKRVKVVLALLFIVFIYNGFWDGKSIEEQRKENYEDRYQRIIVNNSILAQLYRYDSKAKDILLRSYGYATFTNIGLNVVLFSAEGGVGLAHSNHTGKNIYMNMVSGGLGFGLGVKDFSIILLFRNQKVFRSFVKNGWEANAQADITAIYDKKGISLNKAITIAPGIRMYKLTTSGLALQVTIQGSRYWRDEDLNR
jgi:lipid-binding SYLF domain-containing protein